MHGLQFHNQGRSPPNPFLANQSQACQQLLSQNIQNSIPSAEVRSSAHLPSAMPPISGLNQTSTRNVVGQDMNVQSIFGTSQNLVFANNQWQMQGRHQVFPLQQQQSQNPQQYLYQQQLQQQLLYQKFQQGSISHLLEQKKTQQLQQQQNLLEANQLQSSQQSVKQTSYFIQPSVMQSYPLSGLRQNQQPFLLQATQSMVQQYPQSVLMQQQQPQQAAVLHQHQTSMQLQPVLPPQQQLMGQLSKALNMQQELLLAQWSSVGDMQQQQQQALLGQQNNLENMQQLQQQFMAQHDNLYNMHQQQLGSQSNISVLQRQQPQLLGTQSIKSSMQTNQHSVHMLQQSGVQVQQQSQQSTPDLLPTRGKQLQSQQQPPQQQQQQLIYQIQSQPLELHQQPNSLKREMLQRLQASGQESSFKYHIWLLFNLVIICASIYFIFMILGDS